MGHVDPDAHRGDVQPKLEPHILEGAEIAVLTIDAAHTNIPTTGGRSSAFLEFREAPGYSYWLNYSGLVTLCAKLGDDDDDWPGKSVVLEAVRVQNPTTGEYVDKYHVADPDEWEAAMKEGKKRKTSSKKKPRGTKKK